MLNRISAAGRGMLIAATLAALPCVASAQTVLKFGFGLPAEAH